MAKQKDDWSYYWVHPGSKCETIEQEIKDCLEEVFGDWHVLPTIEVDNQEMDYVEEEIEPGEGYLPRLLIGHPDNVMVVTDLTLAYLKGRLHK